MLFWIFRALFVFQLVCACLAQFKMEKRREDHLLPNVTCYEPIGCISFEPGWYDERYRPFYDMPQARERVATNFKLFTRQNPYVGQIFDGGIVNYICTSIFSPERPTKIIVHGFTSSSKANWVKKLTSAILEEVDANVIVVDWENGAVAQDAFFLHKYEQACANGRLVGLELAYIIKKFQEEPCSLDPADIHIIGHSIGAHVAGYVGETIKGIARITGMDPANFYFENMPEYVRLDPSDAKFVDVYHTDSGFFPEGLGIKQPCGHKDFYINGGSAQPACRNKHLITNLAIHDPRFLIACSHLLASRYFIASITDGNNCSFIAYKCPNFGQFLQGKCFDVHNTSLMGYHAIPPSSEDELGSYFLITNNDKPLCAHQYLINVEFQKHPRVFNFDPEALDISVLGEDDDIIDVNLSDSIRSAIVSGGVASNFFISHSVKIKTPRKLILSALTNKRFLIKKVTFTMLDDTSKLVPVHFCGLKERIGGGYLISSKRKRIFVPCNYNTTPLY